jgi:hypothetical protein
MVYRRGGKVAKVDDGRMVTVRALGRSLDPQFAVRVDDGRPDDPDLLTNGHRRSYWLPLDAVEPIEGAAGKETGG